MKLPFDKFMICLAPMAGVTDFFARKICADFGADMTTTEMVSAKALSLNSEKTKDLLFELPHDGIKCVQLFGHDIKAIENVLQSTILDNFDIIDFNCGCPAPKIVKNNDGSAMMKNIEKTRKVISCLVQNSKKPVSVKFRLGTDGVNNYIEFAKMCQDEGVAFLTLHARTKEQGYSGSVDWNAYRQIVQAVNIPVFASGDIVDEASFQQAIDCGVKGVMIGRASMGNPYIFEKLKIYANKIGLNGECKNCKNISVFEIANEHLSSLLDYYKNENFVVAYFKKHLAWYMKTNKNSVKERTGVMQIKTLDELKIALYMLKN